MENNNVLVILPYNSLDADEVMQNLFANYDTNLFMPLVKLVQMQHKDYVLSLLLSAEFSSSVDFDENLCFGLCKKDVKTFTHIICYKQYTCSVQEEILRQKQEYKDILDKCYTSEDATENYKTIKELEERLNQLIQKKEGQ